MRISQLIFGCVLILALSCNSDDDHADQVPRFPTDFLLNLNLPEYSVLQNPGGWLYLTGGSRGIVVYRISPIDFAVHDRHCTFQVSQACRIVVEDTNITTIDEECCSSRFSLVDGVPLNGPAKRPLLRYQTQYNQNTNTLRIFN